MNEVKAGGHDGIAIAMPMHRRDPLDLDNSCGKIFRLWCRSTPVAAMNSMKAAVGVLAGLPWAAVRAACMVGINDAMGNPLSEGAVLAATVVTSLAFDEVVLRPFITANLAHLTEKDGTPEEEHPLRDAALAAVPSAVACIVLANALFRESDETGLFAAHLTTMSIDYRFRRLSRDFAQVFFSEMPRIAVRNQDGTPLTHDQEVRLDNARYGTQKWVYMSITILVQVLTLALRRGLGSVEDERGGHMRTAFLAMLAALLATMVGEMLDEFNGVYSKIWHAVNMGLKTDNDWSTFRFLPHDGCKALQGAFVQGRQRVGMGLVTTDMANVANAYDPGAVLSLLVAWWVSLGASQTAERSRYANLAAASRRQQVSIKAFARAVLLEVRPELAHDTKAFGKELRALTRNMIEASRKFFRAGWPRHMLTSRLLMMSPQERSELCNERILPLAVSPRDGEIEMLAILSRSGSPALEPDAALAPLRALHGNVIHTLDGFANDVLRMAADLDVPLTEAHASGVQAALRELVVAHAEAGWGNQAVPYLKSLPALHLLGLVRRQMMRGDIKPVEPVHASALEDLPAIARRMAAQPRAGGVIGIPFTPSHWPLEDLTHDFEVVWARFEQSALPREAREKLAHWIPHLLEAARDAGWGRYASDWIRSLPDSRKWAMIQRRILGSQPVDVDWPDTESIGRVCRIDPWTRRERAERSVVLDNVECVVEECFPSPGGRLLVISMPPGSDLNLLHHVGTPYADDEPHEDGRQRFVVQQDVLLGRLDPEDCQRLFAVLPAASRATTRRRAGPESMARV